MSAQARGKSGPLFHFDVHEDVRLENDARVEKDESHAGKVWSGIGITGARTLMADSTKDLK